MVCTVAIMTTDSIAKEFFTTYARALLDRDASKLAQLYAVPALIEFPGQAIAVSAAEQTEQFFAASFGQYEGVTEARPTIEVIASTGHSIWADVTWSYDGEARERFVYQLVRVAEQWKIAVLTLMTP